MQAHSLADLTALNLETCLLHAGTYILTAEHGDIAFADRSRQRHLEFLNEEAYDSIVRSHVSENQASVGLEHAVSGSIELVNLGIVMSGHGTNDHVETVLREGKVLTITYNQFRVRELLLLRDFDHLLCKIDAGVVLLRILLEEQGKHRGRAAAGVKQGLEGFLLNLRQDIRVVLLTELVDTGMITLILLCCFGELLDGEVLIFFTCLRRSLFFLSFIRLI